MSENMEAFNDAAMTHHKSGGHGKWMVLHGVLMLGMVLPMIAMAAPAGAATLGDLAVQSLYMVSGMISGLTQNFGIIADIASNSVGGEFAAQTLEAGAMHGGVTHGAAALTGFDQWLGALSSEEIAVIQSDLQGPYNGMSMRQYFEMNFGHGVHGP